MTPTQIAALIIAGAVVLLVILLAIPLIKLSRTLDEARLAIRQARENSDPLFTGANSTLTHVNTQLERVDGMTADAKSVTGNVSALSSLFTATLGGPLVKTAAFSYGVAKALRARRKRKQEPEGRHSRKDRKKGLARKRSFKGGRK